MITSIIITTITQKSQKFQNLCFLNFPNFPKFPHKLRISSATAIALAASMTVAELMRSLCRAYAGLMQSLCGAGAIAVAVLLPLRCYRRCGTRAGIRLMRHKAYAELMRGLCRAYAGLVLLPLRGYCRCGAIAVAAPGLA